MLVRLISHGGADRATHFAATIRHAPPPRAAGPGDKASAARFNRLITGHSSLPKALPRPARQRCRVVKYWEQFRHIRRRGLGPTTRLSVNFLAAMTFSCSRARPVFLGHRRRTVVILSRRRNLRIAPSRRRHRRNDRRWERRSAPTLRGRARARLPRLKFTQGDPCASARRGRARAQNSG
jgi:hypothetical protein